MLELVGSRAVVTGASWGIGGATARALATAGANVAGIYRAGADERERAAAKETVATVRAVGREAIMLEGDAGSSADVDGLARAAADAWGGIDIWVNNAARLLVRPLLETTDEEWHSLLAPNLHGYFYGCRAAARVMAEQGGGAIVNVASIANHQPVAEFVAYSTAKGGVAAMTRALAVELAPLGIRVNAISPGATDTPLNEKAYTPDVRRNYEARIALHRIATPEEVADAIVFLASTASRYMTGQDMIVDGGMLVNGTVGHART